MSQEQRQYLWEQSGKSGIAPVGYGGEGGMGAGGVPTFNFDYEKAAKDAYGELGPYYLRLLQESQGDMNKVLTRLTEDYDRGFRTRSEDNVVANQASERSNADNMLARGLLQQSNFAPKTGGNVLSAFQNPQDRGFGIADLVNPDNAYGNSIRQRNIDATRANEEALISKQRSEIDLPEEQKRREFALEQERREKSAVLAEQKGARAYQDYSAKLATSPVLA